MVRALARRYAGRSEPIEDLVQVGSIGLIKSIDRFDPDRGVEFTTYAIPTIIGELKRHFRDKGWAVHVPRRLKELSLQLGQLVESLGAKLGRSPTVTELADAARVDEEEVLEALEIGQAYSGGVPVGSGRARGLRPRSARHHRRGGRRLRHERRPGRARAGAPRSGRRERRILELRFHEGLTQSQIAREVGISQMHVSRLIRKSLETMREELQSHETARRR